MKTLFDPAVQAEVIRRATSLTGNDTAQWGNMSVYQMVKHGRLWTEMMLSRLPCKRVFLGRFFGTMALKRELTEGSPMRRNSPTSAELKVQETAGDFAAERSMYIERMKELAAITYQEFNHPFFGVMTKEQVGYFAYKHIDHHLRQFDV